MSQFFDDSKRLTRYLIGNMYFSSKPMDYSLGFMTQLATEELRKCKLMNSCKFTREFRAPIVEAQLVKSTSDTSIDESPNSCASPVAYNVSEYTETSSVSSLPKRIVVVNEDCLEVAIHIAKSGVYGRPSVLNMANAYNCGGGFCSHNGSQEEYLFRNTTLAASLWPYRRIGDERWTEAATLLPRQGSEDTTSSTIYPFTECGGVFSPHVLIHSVKDKPIEKTEDIQCCSVLSIAAQDLRNDRTYNANQVFDYNLTIEKFRTLFYIAVTNDVHVLVLGPIGCGAFKNPPDAIARAFATLLLPGGEFYEKFDLVVFSIIFSERNLKAFESVFGNHISLLDIP